MSVPRDEMESTIRLGYYDDELVFNTTNPAHARHMDRLGVKPFSVSRVATAWEEVSVKRKGEVVVERGNPIEWDEVAWTFKVPADWFKLPRPKRQVSEAQRAHMSQMAQLRFGNGGDADESDDD
jgi:hypothetical protein